MVFNPIHPLVYFFFIFTLFSIWSQLLQHRRNYPFLVFTGLSPFIENRVPLRVFDKNKFIFVKIWKWVLLPLSRKKFLRMQENLASFLSLEIYDFALYIHHHARLVLGSLCSHRICVPVLFRKKQILSFFFVKLTFQIKSISSLIFADLSSRICLNVKYKDSCLLQPWELTVM